MKHPANINHLQVISFLKRFTVSYFNTPQFELTKELCDGGYVSVNPVMFNGNHSQMHQFYLEIKHTRYVSSVLPQVIHFWSLGRLSRLTILDFQYFSWHLSLQLCDKLSQKKLSKLNKLRANVIFYQYQHQQ